MTLDEKTAPSLHSNYDSQHSLETLDYNLLQLTEGYNAHFTKVNYKIQLPKQPHLLKNNTGTVA
jgi:hypothetical protein